jgi:hypothetical protein
MTEFLHSPASRVFDHYHLTGEMLVLWDEPPGKLRGFSFTISSEPEKREIWVGLEYHPSLLSLSRTWSADAIREAKINFIADRPWWMPQQ